MRRYSRQIDEVIWDRYCKGLTQVEIQSALASDASTIEEIGSPVEMPIRTIGDKLRRLREERGDPENWIFPGQELEVCKQLQQKIIGIVSREVEKLTGVEGATVEQVKMLKEWQLLLTRHANHLSETKDPAKQAAGRRRHATSDEDLFALIAADESERASENGAEPDPCPPVSA